MLFRSPKISGSDHDIFGEQQRVTPANRDVEERHVLPRSAELRESGLSRDGGGVLLHRHAAQSCVSRPVHVERRTALADVGQPIRRLGHPVDDRGVERTGRCLGAGQRLQMTDLDVRDADGVPPVLHDQSSLPAEPVNVGAHLAGLGTGGVVDIDVQHTEILLFETSARALGEAAVDRLVAPANQPDDGSEVA